MSLFFNAGRAIPKCTSRNFIPPKGIDHLAVILIKWREEEKLSRIVDHAELKKNDYNISPAATSTPVTGHWQKLLWRWMPLKRRRERQTWPCGRF